MTDVAYIILEVMLMFIVCAVEFWINKAYHYHYYSFIGQIYGLETDLKKWPYSKVLEHQNMFTA